MGHHLVEQAVVIGVNPFDLYRCIYLSRSVYMSIYVQSTVNRYPCDYCAHIYIYIYIYIYICKYIYIYTYIIIIVFIHITIITCHYCYYYDCVCILQVYSSRYNTTTRTFQNDHRCPASYGKSSLKSLAKAPLTLGSCRHGVKGAICLW